MSPVMMATCPASMPLQPLEQEQAGQAVSCLLMVSSLREAEEEEAGEEEEDETDMAELD